MSSAPRSAPASSADTPTVEGSQPIVAQLGLWDAISIIIGIVIGAGIYETAPLIFQNVSSPGMALAAWGLGGVLSLIGAFCYAELASTYPRLGGDYVYLSRAYGSWAGFLFGWAQLAVLLTGSIGMMAYIFANYAATLCNLPSNVAFLLAAAAVVILTLLNILGVVCGKWTQNVLSIAKVLGLGGILVAGFCYPHTWASSQAESPQSRATESGLEVPVAPVSHAAVAEDSAAVPAGDRPADPADKGTVAEEAEAGGATLGFHAFALAMVLVFLTYGGWNDAAFVAAEVRDRQRNLPLALILGTCGVALLYLAVNGAYLLSLGFEGARQSQAIAADVMKRPWGVGGEKAMSVLVMVSALGAVNGLIFTGSRIYCTLGNDHKLFAWLGHWHPRLKSPAWSLGAQGLISVLLILGVGTALGQQALSAVIEGIGNSLIHAANGLLGLQWSEVAPLDWQGRGGFESLLKCTAPVFWLFFLSTAISLFVLRWKDPHIVRPFSAPLYPLVPLIFCATCVYMLYSGILYADKLGLVGILLLLLGLPIYGVSCWWGRQSCAA